MLGLGVLPGYAVATVRNFDAGSLVLPMDTDTAGNHASFNQNQGMWKAYGLVYRLLQNGVPVHWAIQTGKAYSGIDVSASSMQDLRTATALGSWDYRGGPFVIDAADAATALPIIQSWWAAKTNQPNVHLALASFSANVDVVLRSAPRIANEAINAGITLTYYNAAGIPDSAGNAWTTSSPDVLDQTEIANGALFQTGACQRRQYDIFVTPHNSGYSYSLTDPNNLGTKTYAAFDTFVHQGGGWTALCHSILSNENFINDLTRNGSPTVKALFKTSQGGGQPGGFLTTHGFSTISNTSGTWTVDPISTGLPVAQSVSTTVAQALPGGSVQTWPHSGAGAPTYWSNSERIAYFDAGGVQHDHTIAGTYHNATGAGKVTFIGGHSYSTAVPYATNFEGPYLRQFYNSLFFNSNAVARLELEAPGSYPQNGVQPLSLSIVNNSATTATNVNNTTVILEAGFTYLGTTFGPAPDSVMGQTLVWNSLGNIAGGSTAVTIQVSVSMSVSGTTGLKSFGTFQSNYGDVFGEAFTVDACSEITIAAAPAPSISKSPVTQGPFGVGSEVAWTLNYGNTGPQALLGSVLEDTLPPGFTFVSSSPTPTLVIPGDPTILRWSLGTLNPSASGSITLTALAGAVTMGVGDPPQQTFTNNVELSGTDSGGNALSASDSADVILEKIDLDLSKTVDIPSLSSVPGSVTYTITPAYTGTALLQGASVSDSLPGIDTSTDPPGVSSYARLVPGASSPNAGGYCNQDPDTACDGMTAYEVDWDLGSNTPGVPGLSAPTGTAFCPTLVSLNPTKDTYLRKDQGNTNFGSATTIFTDPAKNNTENDTKHGLIEFDVSGVPSGAILQSAVLGMNVSTAQGGKHFDQVRVMTTDWTEAGATYNKRDGSNNWASGVFSGADYGTAAVATLLPKKTGFKTVDVTSAVNDWVNNSVPNRGLALLSTGTDNRDAKYDTRESANDPYLNVTYLTATAGGCMGPSSPQANADTSISKEHPTENVGGNDPVKVNPGNNDSTAKTRIMLVRFDLGSIPPGATISSAELRMTVKTAKNNHVDEVHRMTTAWTEDGATYSKRDGSSPWAGGGSFSSSDYAASSLGSITPSSNGLKTLDITSQVDDWVNNGVPNRGLVLLPTGTDNADAEYYTRENATASNRPQLVVNWTLAASMSAGTSVSMVTSPLLVVGNSQPVTVKMTVSAEGTVTGVTPPASLTDLPDAGILASLSTGPTPAGPVTLNGSPGTPDSVVFTYVYDVSAGTQPGEIAFSGKPTGSATFVQATSNSTLVTPPLQFQMQILSGSPNQVVNTALFSASGTTESSPPAGTGVGSPTLTLVKENSPLAAVHISPGDPITYTLTLENSGSGVANNIVVSDSIPANTTFVAGSCTPTCLTSGAPVTSVTWSVASLDPGKTSTFSFQVTGDSGLAIGSHTITNTASVDSDETTPGQSNQVDNTLDNFPTITKDAAQAAAAIGGQIDYTLTVFNPGTTFTADITDAIPTGSSYVAASCTPACTTTGVPVSSLSWLGASIPPGTSTFTFSVTVTAAGGATIVNQGSLDPSSPDLSPIPSNEVDVPVGPVLAIVKVNNPQGNVSAQDNIVYTLTVTNESDVPATNVQVTDAVPANSSYVSCSGGSSCGESMGTVTWDVGGLAANGQAVLSMTVEVVAPTPGSSQVDNVGSVSASEAPMGVQSNPVSNLINTPSASNTPTQTATQTPTRTPTSTPTSSATPTFTPTQTPTSTSTRTPSSTPSFTPTSTGTQTPTSTPTRTPTASPSSTSTQTPTATPRPDLEISKSHGPIASSGQVTFTLTVRNVSNTSAPGPIEVTDNLASSLTLVSASGSGWSCSQTQNVICTHPGPVPPSSSLEKITIVVMIQANQHPVTNVATVASPEDLNAGNNTARVTLPLAKVVPAASPNGLLSLVLVLALVSALALHQAVRDRE